MTFVNVESDINSLREYLNFMQDADLEKYQQQNKLFRSFSDEYLNSDQGLIETLLFIQQTQSLELSSDYTKQLLQKLNEIRDQFILKQKSPTPSTTKQRHKSMNSSNLNISLHSSTNQHQFVAKLDKLTRTSPDLHVRFFDDDSESTHQGSDRSEVFSEIQPQKPFKNDDYVEVMIQQEMEIQTLQKENGEYKRILLNVIQALQNMEFDGKDKIMQLLE